MLPFEKLGVYEIKEQIGRGGIATVFKAYHPATQRDVAIKVLSRDIAGDRSFQLRFEREARIVANLQHIHILPVFDYGQQGDTAYLVMPLITGGTLSRRLLKGKFEPQEAAKLFRQLASALDFAHQRGILHRDIKPGNILLDSSGNVLLADFGLTRMIGEDKNITRSSIVGTPAYMSPEQGQGLDLDARSDLYSLGVVLFEMLTGDVPFEADTPVALIYKHVSDPLPDLRKIHPNLPSGVATVLEKALAKLPSQRYPSATAIADALDAALAGKLIAPVKAWVEPPTVTTELAAIQDEEGATRVLPSGKVAVQRRRRLYAIGAVLLLGVLVVSAFFMMNNDSKNEENSEAKKPAYALEIPAHTEEGVLKIALNADGTRLISGGADNVARVWETTTGELIYKLEGMSSDVYAVGYGDGMLFTGGEGGYFVWNEAEGTVAITGLEGGRVRNGVFSPSGKHLAYTADVYLAAGDMTGGLYNGGFYTANANESSFLTIAFTPDESNIIAGDAAGTVQIWTLAGEVEATLEQHQAPVLAVTASEKILASADENGQIYLWDDNTPRALEKLDGAVNALAFSPDGSRLASAGADGLIRVWEVESGEIVLTFEQGAAVNSVIFSPDGTQLISGGADGRLLFWVIS